MNTITQNTALIPRRRNPPVKKSHLIQLQNEVAGVMNHIKEKEEEAAKEIDSINSQIKKLLESNALFADHIKKIENKMDSQNKEILKLKKNIE